MVASRSLWTSFLSLGRPFLDNPSLLDTLLGRRQCASLPGDALALTGIRLVDMPMLVIHATWAVMRRKRIPQPVCRADLSLVALFGVRVFLQEC